MSAINDATKASITAAFDEAHRPRRRGETWRELAVVLVAAIDKHLPGAASESESRAVFRELNPFGARDTTFPCKMWQEEVRKALNRRFPNLAKASRARQVKARDAHLRSRGLAPVPNLFGGMEG